MPKNGGIPCLPFRWRAYAAPACPDFCPAYVAVRQGVEKPSIPAQDTAYWDTLLTWEELLVPSPRQRSADPPPEELTDWRWACHFCLERYWLLTSWELNFVATVARYTKPP